MGNFNELIKGDKPVLVDFFATWCGPCKMMSPILDELKKTEGDRIHVLKIDIDKAVNQQIVSQHQIQSVPTFLLYKNGKVVWRKSGVIQLPSLKEIVEKYI
ncbi:thioredoxin [Odoribacter sp. OttesenSCG-928-G04]|nr:thioredoxin [Odoribacter sp. OttesenSCG-928-G04]